MNYDSIPDALQTKLRVAILSALCTGEKDFNTLKELLNATDGNLGIQLMKLEQYGYLRSNKNTEGGRKRTFYSLTEQGRTEFNEYVEMLIHAVKGIT